MKNKIAIDEFERLPIRYAYLFLSEKGFRAKCELCEQDMDRVYSCIKRMDEQIPLGSETHCNMENFHCPKCGIGTGGFHHPECPIEECPKCHGQLLFCGCMAFS
jgi:hypothetical protein